MEGPEWYNVSEEAKIFISKMLEYNPEKRYDAFQAANDPWMLKWKNIENLSVSLPVLNNTLTNMRKFNVKEILQIIINS